MFVEGEEVGYLPTERIDHPQCLTLLDFE